MDTHNDMNRCESDYLMNAIVTMCLRVRVEAAKGCSSIRLTASRPIIHRWSNAMRENTSADGASAKVLAARIVQGFLMPLWNKFKFLVELLRLRAGGATVRSWKQDRFRNADAIG